MNLELEPEEYQDVDVTISIIIEAVKLLLASEDDSNDPITFPSARLKRGYGPEVIWAMNILADRALEIAAESEIRSDQIRIIYHNKGSSETDGRRNSANSITIGQPYVGGSLTTRPLGSYQIDDSSLVFPTSDEPTVEQPEVYVPEAADWYQQVERARSRLQIVDLSQNQSDHLKTMRKAREAIRNFLNESSSLLNIISSRIERQMQVIDKREKFIHTNLKNKIDKFMEVWRHFSRQSSLNGKLTNQVNRRTDLFESHNLSLKTVNNSIESRRKELNDGSRLRELEEVTKRLRSESDGLNFKIGLLLTVYATNDPLNIARDRSMTMLSASSPSNDP